MADKEKSTWDTFKTGLSNAFKPVDAVADDNIAEKRKKGPSQYEIDRSEGAEAMRSKFKQGFFGK